MLAGATIDLRARDDHLVTSPIHFSFRERSAFEIKFCLLDQLNAILGALGPNVNSPPDRIFVLVWGHAMSGEHEAPLVTNRALGLELAPLDAVLGEHLGDRLLEGGAAESLLLNRLLEVHGDVALLGGEEKKKCNHVECYCGRCKAFDLACKRGGSYNFGNMRIEDLHQANRVGWNQGAESYEADLQERTEFLRAGGTNFCPPEYAYLADIKDWCRRAIHLQCAGGTDTLSLWNLGAHEVVGVDISERMLGVAKQKSDALGAPATWVHSDILSTPHELDGTADLVYTGRGALCWLMDIEAWARVVARLLKPSGRLYVYEGHPISNLFKLETTTFELDPEYGDYFKKEPIADSGWPETYIGDLGKPKSEHAVKYERLWTLGDIVNAVIGAGLVVKRLEEHPDSFWDSHPNMPPELLRRVPQTFSLLASKQ